MKPISTKVHGILDYMVSLFIIASPWLLGFSRDGIESWVLVGSGIVTLVYSLLTKYEAGLIPVLSMRIHLMLDLLSAFFLAFSPWLFGFADYVWLPHVLIGITEMIVVALSSSVSGTEVKERPGGLSSR